MGLIANEVPLETPYCFFFETTETARKFKIRSPSGYLFANGTCEDNECLKVYNNGQESDVGATFTIGDYKFEGVSRFLKATIIKIFKGKTILQNQSRHNWLLLEDSGNP